MSSRSFPRSVIVFGLLNTALGTLGLTSGIRALLRPQQTIEVYQQVDMSTQSIEWLRLAMVISPISFAVMLICGIALLRKKAWGRTLAIYYGAAWITYTLIFRGINIFRVIDKTGSPIALNTILGWILTGLLVFVYGAAMIYFLSPQRVKQALLVEAKGADILEFKPVRKKRLPRQ